VSTSATRVDVAIVGAGIGGTEMAGYLALTGHDVRIHDVRAEAVNGVGARGGLEVSGVVSGFAAVKRATTNLADAVDGAALIAITTLNNDHDAVATALSPLLRDGQTICLIPGYVGGTLHFRRSLESRGCRARVRLGEIDNFPFTGAILGPAAVRVGSLKREFHVAALPTADGPAVFELVRRALPPATLAANVLETGLGTMNPIIHVPGMLGNQARLDAGEAFQFYGSGITRSVARVVDVLDGERVAVARAFGVTVPTMREWLGRTYGLVGDDLYELVQRLHREIFKDSPAPSTLDARYVTEDVPYGLVPLVALGRLAGVPTPIAAALATVASAALARDFLHEGRTLERMGLEGQSLDGVRAAMR
jgi:opine dehydrogenase